MTLCDIIGDGYFLSRFCWSTTYGFRHATPVELAFNLSAQEVSIFTQCLVSSRNLFWYHFLARLIRARQSPVVFHRSFSVSESEAVAAEPRIWHPHGSWFFTMATTPSFLLRMTKHWLLNGRHMSEMLTLRWKIDLGLPEEKILFKGMNILLVSRAIG